MSIFANKNVFYETNCLFIHIGYLVILLMWQHCHKE